VKISPPNFIWNFKEKEKKKGQELTDEKNIKTQNFEFVPALKNYLIVDTFYH